jgi:hypothetical protein
MLNLKKIMLISVIGLHITVSYADEPIAVSTSDPMVANVLAGLNRVLGLNGVTNNVQLKLIVDTLQDAKELLQADEKNLAAAQDLIEKAQNLPGKDTMVTPGGFDNHGHPVSFSMWRMLALVRNGKDPIAE